MKYVLMFIESEHFAKDWESRSEAERQELYGKVDAWFAEHADRIVHTTRLQGADAATTVRNGDDGPVVTDGPFVEGKEVVGGYVEIEVADLDEALLMARSWPSCPTVEIRPVFS